MNSGTQKNQSPRKMWGINICFKVENSRFMEPSVWKKNCRCKLFKKMIKSVLRFLVSFLGSNNDTNTHHRHNHCVGKKGAGIVKQLYPEKLTAEAVAPLAATSVTYTTEKDNQTLPAQKWKWSTHIYTRERQHEKTWKCYSFLGKESSPVANRSFVMMMTRTACDDSQIHRTAWISAPSTAFEHDMKTRLSLSNSLSLAWNGEDSGFTLWDALGPFKLPSCATSHSTFPPSITTILYVYFVWFQHHITLLAKILHQLIDSRWTGFCAVRYHKICTRIMCACWVGYQPHQHEHPHQPSAGSTWHRPVETWVSDRYRAQHIIHLAAPAGPCCCPGSQGIPS